MNDVLMAVLVLYPMLTLPVLTYFWKKSREGGSDATEESVRIQRRMLLMMERLLDLLDEGVVPGCDPRPRRSQAPEDATRTLRAVSAPSDDEGEDLLKMASSILVSRDASEELRRAALDYLLTARYGGGRLRRFRVS